MLTRSMWLAAASSGACCTIPRTVRGVASQLRAPRRAAAAVLHTRGQTRRGFGSDVRDTRAGTVYAVAKEGTGTQPPLLPPNLPSYEEWSEGHVMLIDKPKGWTSFDVCGKLRGQLKRSGCKKVGHAGTLDPMATGLLIVCCGKATKQVDLYQAMDKLYTGTLKLGEATPSYDAETEVEERLPWEHITDAQLIDAAATFLGQIDQLPPMYSAIKVDGKRLYKAAREGKVVERKTRSVNVAEFHVERDAADPQLVHFRVECSKGTYIRSLVYDIGRVLGTCAHMTALRRERIGEHCIADAWEVEALADLIYAQRRQFIEVQEAKANNTA